MFSNIPMKEGWNRVSGQRKTLVTDGDDLTVGKLVALLERGRGGGGGHLILKVQGDVAELLLDVTDNLTLGCGGRQSKSYLFGLFHTC